MAGERIIPDDVVERLNALIDGELPPAEHAALADRIAADRDLAHAHATLARLKARVVESAETGSVAGVELPKAPRRPPPVLRMGRAGGIAVGAATAAAAIVSIFLWQREPVPEPALNAELAPIIVLAALPAAPVIPDLGYAGLKLVGGEVERSGETDVLVAAYRGPRGCRLELRVRPQAANVPPTVGTSRRIWTAGDLTYELVAFGMPAGRFMAVAAAAMDATRAGQMPSDAETRLREASLAAPPCTG